eukprot:CAMPEP_0114689094 /NCGR_PEP_ID=MMETSP0191-20121206/64160_1 /TAXON_ID=126664 /ORGANISM="Sorites sp." /LENGTH=65 /DNA_ID=CAMNT_0001977285 /DNA_START=39 /DNA_END=233 /DNA_ORIENTATION=-
MGSRSIHISIKLQQTTDDLQVIFLCGNVQRSSPVLCFGVAAGICFHEQPNDLHMATLSCKVHGSS